ncbi:MAG: YaaR family protein [Bacillota bacterium]
MPRVQRAGEGGRSSLTPEVGRAPARPAGAADFHAQFQSARLTQARHRLDELLSRIDALGAELAERMTLGSLRAYREAVREFLRTVQEAAVQVETEMEWDYRSWEHRTLTIVRKVNQELEALAQDLMDREQGRLRLLERLGEIKGLLLDLLF